MCICCLTRRIFGAKRAEVTGDWRELHNEELYAFYSLQNIIRVIRSRRMRLEGHVERMGDRGVEYRVWVGRHDGKRPLEKSRPRWDDNVKMDFQQME